MEIAFVLGHHKRDKGAFSPHLGLSEYDFYDRVAPFLKGVDVIRHDHTIGGYKTRIKNTSYVINRKNYGLVMEAHFNSAANPSAHGCETLYYFDSKIGKYYAEKFSNVVHQCTGIPMRGVNGAKPLVNAKDRGFASVYYPKHPAILIEPFFGSNEGDCRIIKGPEFMASIIQDFIDAVNRG